MSNYKDTFIKKGIFFFFWQDLIIRLNVDILIFQSELKNLSVLWVIFFFCYLFLFSQREQTVYFVYCFVVRRFHSSDYYKHLVIAVHETSGMRGRRTRRRRDGGKTRDKHWSTCWERASIKNIIINHRGNTSVAPYAVVSFDFKRRRLNKIYIHSLARRP